MCKEEIVEYEMEKTSNEKALQNSQAEFASIQDERDMLEGKLQQVEEESAQLRSAAENIDKRRKLEEPAAVSRSEPLLRDASSGEAMATNSTALSSPSCR